MKLKAEKLKRYAESHGLSEKELSKELGISTFLIAAARDGQRIGYDEVRDFYNRNGEALTRELIDFEEDTINGFKAKYIQIGSKLY